MLLKPKPFLVALIIVLAFVSTQSHTQETSPGYVGLGLGQFSYYEDASQFGRSNLEDEATVRKIFGGYRFNDRWAVEGSFASTGDLSWTESFADPNFGTITSHQRADYDFLSVRTLMHFSGFNIGAGYFTSDNSGDITISSPCCGTIFGTVHIPDDDGLTLLVGYQWDVDSGFSFRIEYEWFDTEVDEVDTWAIGVGMYWTIATLAEL